MPTQQTDSSGEATFSIDPGDYSVTASASGYSDATSSISVEASEERTVVMTLDSDAPSYRVDDFERSSTTPWSTRDGYESITTTASSALAPGSGRGLYMQPGASGAVSSGLDNFPQAGGGPNNDGAHELWCRIDETGGTADICRIDFAVGGGQWYRWQVQPDYVGFRANSTDIASLNPSLERGDVVRLRVNEWLLNGDMDVGIYDQNGTELAQESFTDSRSNRPQSGSLRTWANASTAFSIDDWRLIP